VVDGKLAGDVDERYVLSPQDLMGVQHVPALIDAGVACLKIEGRLKGPEYVALTTRVYRDAVDAAWAGRDLHLGESTRRELQQVFSRGLTPGFLEGKRHQRLVRGRFPKHRGVRVGRVTSVSGRRIGLHLEGPIKAGDGVVFDAGRPQEREIGGTVHTVLAGRPEAVVTSEIAAGEVTIKLGVKARVRDAQVGDILWRTRDPALVKRLEATWTSSQRRAAVNAVVEGTMGGPVTVTLRDDAGRVGVGETDRVLEEARARVLDIEAVRASVGRLGGTTLQLRDLQVDLPAAFLPISSLNRARRAAAEALIAERRRLRVRETAVVEVAPREARLASSGTRFIDSENLSNPSVSVLCRDIHQVRAAIATGVSEIVVDFLEVKGLREAMAEVQAAGIRAVAASPRVLKPAEENIRAFLLKGNADAILVRSLGLLHSLLEADGAPPLYGDFSLNATNRRTADLLFGAGLARLAPGHDLNAVQIAELARGPWASRVEVIVHHHLPIFHTEHCVFARFLSDGDDKKTCGLPCETHSLHLQGRDGERHRVEADMGCRNTVFNATAQSGLRDVERFLSAGVRRFRIELVDHRPDEVGPLVALYRRALAGEVAGRDAFRQLRKESRFGAGLGSLAVLDAPKPEDMKRPGWMAR
jgi:putative protease